MVTHSCLGSWTGIGVEGGILILYKLPMIHLLSEAKIHFYSKTISPALKSSRLSRCSRLPNGLISGVNGKAQRESRHYQKQSLMENFFFPLWKMQLKGTKIFPGPFLICNLEAGMSLGKESDAWDPKNKVLHVTTHTQV